MATKVEDEPGPTLLDADLIIRGERGLFDFEAWLDSRPEGQSQLAAITVAELWHGVERATPTHKGDRERYIRDLIDSLPIIPYTESTALAHACLWAALEGSGKMIGYYDLIVAATALENGSAVATFNTRHFMQVPGLKVIRPA